MRIKAEQLASRHPKSLSAPSEPDIAALAERFDEPLRGEIVPNHPPIPEPPAVPIADSIPEPVPETALLSYLPKPPAKLVFPRNALVSVLAVSTLIPLAILFVRLWPDTMPPQSVSVAPPATAPGATETVFAKKDTARLEPEATARAKTIDKEKTAPSGAFDVTGTLSSGANGGAAGWSITSDVASALSPFWAPAQTAAPETSETSETSVMDGAPSPTPTETTAEEDQPNGDTAAAPPPSAPAETEAPVRTVKVVTIKPPGEKKPYDGAYALGAPADEPAEWMVTKTAVDMHAQAKQSSDTVKVAQAGMKVRVTDRHRGWIQVHDPKSSTTGWIYNRFLKPAEAAGR